MNPYQPALAILEPITNRTLYTTASHGSPFQMLQQQQILTLVAEEYLPFFIDARERALPEMKELRARRSEFLKKHTYTSKEESLASALKILPKEVLTELADMDVRMGVLMTAVCIISVNCSTSYTTSTSGQTTAVGDIKVAVANTFGEVMVMQAVSVPQTYNNPMPQPPCPTGMGMPSFGAPYPGAPFGAQQHQPPAWPHTTAPVNGFPSQST